MNSNEIFDVIIIGGSYAGLSAAMALGRSLRDVLLIDSGLPCNRQTPHAHNFITHDGQTPAEITKEAKRQVGKYETVRFYKGTAVEGAKTEAGFKVLTDTTEVFYGRKLIFATGVKDVMADIAGFSECWGISVIHCPYCHGYEVRNEVTGILDNGDAAIHYAQLISNLTKKLTIFTNGKALFTDQQRKLLEEHKINVVEAEIDRLVHENGQLQEIAFKNGSSASLKALYAKMPFIQHSDIPGHLGCALSEDGFIKVDSLQRTTVPAIYACGDNTSYMRSIATAVASGNFAGAMANKELCEEEF